MFSFIKNRDGTDMGEAGIVEAVNETAGTASVRLKRTSACEGCWGCALGLSGKGGSADITKEMIAEAENKCGAKPGDRVEIILKEGILLRAALIMYGIPLAALVAGAFAGAALFGSAGPGEALTLVLSLVAMAASYALIRLFSKTKDMKSYVPIAVRIIDNNEETEA